MSNSFFDHFPVQNDNESPKEESYQQKQILDHIDAIRKTLIEQYGDNIKNIVGVKGCEKQLKGFIENVVRTSFSGFKDSESIEKIYQNIFGFAFINAYLEDPDFEEMNGNAWNDIEVISSRGWHKCSETFNSPEHAVNIIKKMMAVGGAILNEADPILDSFIGTGLRLTASISPVVDEEVGVTFSLRKLAGREISKEDLVYTFDSYSMMELDFISLCIRNGVSALFGGATSSGKTSDMQTVIKEIAQSTNKRIYCIEENTRELDFIIRNDEGKITSRVVHTKTRENKNKESLKVDSEMLVKAALRYHPDIIIPAEMRGAEALEAVEASLTGHTIVSTSHIQSVTGAYKRVLGLCQKNSKSMSEDMLMTMIVEAFPIVIFKQQLEDKSRRCMKIFEATGYNKEAKKIEGRILFKFVRQGKSGEKIYGKHIQVSYPSFKLCQKLYDNGCELETIQEFNPNFVINDIDDYIEDFILVGEKS